MCPHWVTNRPWYNVTILLRLFGVTFEGLFVTAIDRLHSNLSTKITFSSMYKKLHK